MIYCVGGKPSPPIDLEAKLVGDPSAPFGIVARASSPTGEEVDLEIVLPPGVTATRGDRKACARRCDLRLDARAEDRSRKEIFVRASFGQGRTRMTRVVSLVLFDAPPPPRGTPRRNGRGEAILEFSP